MDYYTQTTGYIKTKEEQAEWTARQLRECGFDTKPLGCKWEF